VHQIDVEFTDPDGQKINFPIPDDAYIGSASKPTSSRPFLGPGFGFSIFDERDLRRRQRRWRAMVPRVSLRRRYACQTGRQYGVEPKLCMDENRT